MKVQEVILRAMSKQLTSMQAAEILGVTDRTIRRMRKEWEQVGFNGLFWRTQTPSRVPIAELEKVLQMYRERYSDFNVRHFHEKLQEDHGIPFSYPWVEKALQTAGSGYKTAIARQTPTPPPAASLAWNVVAHRWQPASMVSGRTFVRPAVISG